MKYLHVIDKKGTFGTLRHHGGKRQWQFTLNRAKQRHELHHASAEAFGEAERDIRAGVTVWPILAIVEPEDALAPSPKPAPSPAKPKPEPKPFAPAESPSPLSVADEKEIEDMTRAELLELADRKGMAVSARTSRTALLEMLREA